MSVALPAGNGAWAETTLGYAPTFSCRFRIDSGGWNTGTKLEGLWSNGIITWYAKLTCHWWQQPLPPPGGWDTLDWIIDLECRILGIPIWTGNAFGSFIEPAAVPAYYEVDFAASHSGITFADRNRYAPVRGQYVQNAEEIDTERQLFLDKDDVGSTASFGILNKTCGAGTMLGADRHVVGHDMLFIYSIYAGALAPASWRAILLDGHTPPCGALNDNGGDATGGSGIINVQTQAWRGTIYAPIRVPYHCPDSEVDGRVLSPVCRMATNGGIEPYNGVPVVDDLMTLRDSVASSPSDTLHGFDSGTLWNLSWGASPAWAAGFFIDRKVGFSILPAWAAAAGAEEDEKDNDLTICQRGYPLNEQDPEVGRTAALTFAHLGAQEVDLPEGAGTRRSNWAGSGAPITVTNNAASIRVQATGAGYAERILVNDWEAIILASGNPWDLVMVLEPTSPLEDFWNWSNYGALAWDVTATWTAAADRDFELLVTYESFDVLADDHNSNPAARVFVLGAATEHTGLYRFTVAVGDKGNPVTVIADLAFPGGAATLPRLFRVTELSWQSLVAGDDFTFTSMELLPEADNGNDSARLQLSFPDSKNAADRFGCAGLVCGQLTFDETDDGVRQQGVQRGIAHSYPLFSIAGDVSQLRVIEEVAGPYGLVDLLNFQQGWTATARDLGNALEDADGNVLIGPVMMLLEEQFDTPAGRLYLSPRYASFTVPYGATYTARPHKILRGALHGIAYYGAREERAAPGEDVPVYRFVGGVPIAPPEQTAVTDEWGHWVAGRLYEDAAYWVRT